MRLMNRLAVCREATASLAACLLLAATAGAQPDRGRVHGVVTDPGGAAVAGARVTTASGAQTVTDAQGRYELAALSAGRHVVTVSAEGFSTTTREVTVDAGATRSADFALALASREERVEVRAASRYSRDLDDLPLSATVVSREQILASAGPSIEEQLRQVAGVQIPFDNSDVLFPVIPSIAMRGLGVGDTATRTLVLLDGQPLNGPFFGNVLWNRAPKHTVSQLEVVRGASSSLFGSFAMGGVVNIVTEVPAARRFDLEALYGENDRLQGNARYADVVGGGKTALSLNGNYYRTDGYLLVREEDQTPVDLPQEGELGNLQARVDTQFSSTAKAFFRAGYNDQSREGGFVQAKTDAQVADATAGADLALGPGTLAIRGFYVHEGFDIDNVRVVEDATTFVSNRHEIRSDDLGLSAQWSRGFGGTVGHLTAGVDARFIDGENDQEVYNSPDVLAARVVGGGKQSTLGAFAEVSVRPGPDTELLGSARFDHFRDSDGHIVTNGDPTVYPERTIDLLSPRLAVRHRFTAQVALRAAYYEGFRAPTLAERYRSFETPTFRGLSNPALDEERVRGGEGGATSTPAAFAGR